MQLLVEVVARHFLTGFSAMFEVYLMRLGLIFNVSFADILNAESNKRICFLNVGPDEVIRSLFYNKNNDSLITVSVYASDNFSSLKCRSTRIECVELFSLAVADLLSSRIFFDILSCCFLTVSIFCLIP